MAKKDFKTGIDGLIQLSFQPEQNAIKEISSTEAHFIKATYYYNEEQLNKIKAIAFYRRKPIGKLIEEALNQYINSYAKLEEAERIFSEKSV